MIPCYGCHSIHKTNCLGTHQRFNTIYIGITWIIFTTTGYITSIFAFFAFLFICKCDRILAFIICICFIKYFFFLWYQCVVIIRFYSFTWNITCCWFTGTTFVNFCSTVYITTVVWLTSWICFCISCCS